MTAKRLHQLGLIDRVIPEPIGGAHRNYDAVMESVREALSADLEEVSGLGKEMLDKRFERIMAYGQFNEK